VPAEQLDDFAIGFASDSERALLWYDRIVVSCLFKIRYKALNLPCGTKPQGRRKIDLKIEGKKPQGRRKIDLKLQEAQGRRR